MKTGLIATLLLSACGAQNAAPSFEKGERGRVVRIIDGDALVLDTGQSVRLIGIEAPATARRNRAAAPYAEEAERLLEDMALGRTVELRYAGLTRDRYDRALAHVFTNDTLGPALWLNVEMLRRGGARLRVYPDTSEGAGPLATAEVEAREAEAGLWSLPAYRPLRADEISADTFGFHIVQGVLGAASPLERHACSRSLMDSRLVLDISPAAGELCTLASGALLEARGYIARGRMEITHEANTKALER